MIRLTLPAIKISQSHCGSKPNTIQNDTTNSDNDIIEKWDGVDNSYPYVIRYVNQTSADNGKIVAARYDGTNNPSILSSQTIHDGSFHHVAFVKQGATLSLYIDGAVDNMTTDTTTGTTSNSSPLFIGQRGGNVNSFTGAMDDVALYNTALTPTEINELYNGRYQFNDLIVAPGAGLTYQATVTNSHPLQSADGNLVATSQYIDPLIAEPALALDFETDDVRVNLGFASNDEMSCSFESCPTAGSGRNSTTGLEFDGVDDRITLPQLYDTDLLSTITFWLKVDSLPASGEVMTVFDTVRSADGTPQNGDIDIWIDSAGYLWFDSYGDTPSQFFEDCSNAPGWPCNTHHGSWSQPARISNPLTVGEWTHINFMNNWHTESGRINHILYVNTIYDSSFYSYPPAGGKVDALGPGYIGNSHDGATAFDGSFDELYHYNDYVAPHMVGSDYASTPCCASRIFNFNGYGDPANTVMQVNDAVTHARKAFCAGTSCPTATTSGQYGNGLQFDGTDDYLQAYPIDLANRSFTIASWYKRDTINRADWLLFQGQYANSIGLHFGFRDNNQFTCAFYANDLDTTAYTDTDWTHWVCSHDATTQTRTLYRNGVQVAQDTNVAPYLGSGDVFIGSRLDGASPMSGFIDELVIIPDAVDVAGAQALMNAPYPAIIIDQPFVPFHVNPASSVTAQGSAHVSAQLSDSRHVIEQEAEAALQLQQAIPYPDASQPNLLYYVPFDDVPASTTFDNVAGDDFSCSGTACPNAGLRGRVDRAAYFDGKGTRRLFRAEDPFGSNLNGFTVAAWVKASHGTVANIGPIELGIGGASFQSNCYFVPGHGGQRRSEGLSFDMPRDQWVHLAATIDKASGVAAVYVDGTSVATLDSCINDADGWLGSWPFNGNWPTIGNKHVHLLTDPLEGYIDDVRAYDKALSPTEIATLVNDSAPIMRFEFDEGEDASNYVDSADETQVGTPFYKTCSEVRFDFVAALNYPPESTHFTLTIDNQPLGRWSMADYSFDANKSLNLRHTICGSQTLSATAIQNDGSMVDLGSTTINASDANGARQVHNFLVFQHALHVNWYEGTETQQVPNPLPGTKGQIGNTALFDGNGYIEVPTSSPVNALTNDLTVMAWINPATVSGTQRILAAGQASSANGIGFGLAGDKLLFTTLGHEDFVSAATVTADHWHHVAVVFDSANDAHFYVDGILKDTVTSTTPATVNSDDPLYIGVLLDASTGNFTQHWKGEIDELAVYRRGLSAEELRSIYLRELRWYRDISRSFIQIDTGNPTVRFLTGEYHDNKPIDLMVSAVDAESAVQQVEYGIKAPTAGSYLWYKLPACRSNEDPLGNAIYCTEIDPSALDGEGRYELKFRAYDLVGNMTEINSVVYVDDTPPVITTTHTGQWLPTTEMSDREQVWTVNIAGTISDPTISGGFAGSGVLTSTNRTTQTLRVRLKDSQDNIVGGRAQRTSINPDGTWSIDFEFVGAAPQGDYKVIVVGRDNVRNRSRGTAELGTLRLDAQPPAPEMATWSLPTNITDTITFSGIAIDRADVGNAVAQYRFEETIGSNIFYDSSYSNHHATCTQCPAVSTSGKLGQGVQFDGSTQYLRIATGPDVFTQTQPAEIQVGINPISTTFSAAAWVNVDDFSSQRTILTQQDKNGTGYDWLFIDTNGNLNSSLGGITKTGSITLTAGSWQHVAIIFDGTDLSLYVDGKLDTSEPRTMVGNDGVFIAGLAKDLSSYPFSGSLDELTIFDRAIAPVEVAALAVSESRGVDSVDIWVETYPFTDTQGTPSWTPVSVSRTVGDELVGWQYGISASSGLEDYYRIHLRSTDVNGNVSNQQRVWRGIIDHMPPRVTVLTGQNSEKTTLYFTIEDNFIDPNSVFFLCGSVTPTISESRHPVTNVVTRVEGSCEFNNGVPVEGRAVACDMFGRCTSKDQNGTTVPTAIAVSMAATNVWQPYWLFTVVGILISLTVWASPRRRDENSLV